jgi:hypothetical protein
MCRREKVGSWADCIDSDTRLLVCLPHADAAGQNTKGEGMPEDHNQSKQKMTPHIKINRNCETS